MEVYRVSDGATTDIGFDSQGLLATADIVSFASGSQVLVSTWYNQGTSGPDAAALSGERPEIYTGTSIRVMGGKPALYPQNAAVGFTDIPINLSNLQPEPWTYWTNFSISKAATNLGVFSLFDGSPNRRINLITPFVPTNNDGALQGIAIDATGTGGIYYQGVDRGTFVTRADTLAQFEEYQTISNIVALDTSFTTANFNDMTLGGTTYFGGYSMHIMQEVMVIPYLSLTGYNQALDINANNYYQITNLPDYTSGLLADYSGAAAAYSVRKLSNTAIKCMRVRRGVPPFDEQDIGFTPAGDLDEAAISTFGGSDMLVVSRWYDQSGKSNHAVQISPGAQPLIYDGAAVITDNGKPVIKAQNGTVKLTTPLSTGVTDQTIFSVNRLDRTGVFWGTNDNNGTFLLPAESGSSSTSIVSQFTNIEMRKNGLTYSLTSKTRGNLYTDFESQHLLTVEFDMTSSGTYQQLGYWTSPDTTFAMWSTQEVIIYPSANKPSTTDRSAIETNINTYYSVYPTSGFLVDYPGSYRAYSLRKLQNLAQYAIRVQRHSGAFDEQDIGFTPSGDLDTQAIIDFAGTDVVGVRTWYNQAHGSSAQDLTQSNTAYQPLIFDGTSVYQSNGKPAIYYDATDKQLDDNFSTGTGIDTDFFNVHQRNSGTGYFNHWEGSGGFQVAAMTTQYVLGWLGGTTGPAVDTDQHVFTGIATGTTGQIRLDGTAYTPGTIASGRTFSGEFAIQGRPGFPGSNPGPGDIYHQEFIQYDFNNTGADVTAIENDIKAYYSIP
jgi:hypothetical protein